MRSPTYRLLWLGQVVANFGDTRHSAVLVVLLFRLTDSGVGLTALSLAQIVLGLALGPIAGVLVHPLDRRALTGTADLCPSILAVALAGALGLLLAGTRASANNEHGQTSTALASGGGGRLDGALGVAWPARPEQVHSHRRRRSRFAW